MTRATDRRIATEGLRRVVRMPRRRGEMSRFGHRAPQANHTLIDHSSPKASVVPSQRAGLLPLQGRTADTMQWQMTYGASWKHGSPCVEQSITARPAGG